MVVPDGVWRQSDTFRYVASLDGRLLAWEYLRRSTVCCDAWLKRDRGGLRGSTRVLGATLSL
jgi:hypothetical protein